MRPDGTDPRQLTQNNVWDAHPHWSPDGRRVVFTSARDSQPGDPGPRPQIYVMNDDGSDVRALTTGRSAREPRWSPDGTRIAFERDDPDSYTRLYVMGSDGSNLRALTTYNDDALSPDWSPDGTKILFLSRRNPAFRQAIHVIRADGSDEQVLNVEACRSNVIAPRWSPSGTHIAYTCWSGYGTGLYVMRADGTDPVRLSPPDGPQAYIYEVFTVWSPDSRQLAFTRSQGGLVDIYVITLSSGAVTRVTNDGAIESVTAWRNGR